MEYADLMKKALAGKSVNARAAELGVGQKTLDRWVKGDNLPDCDGALILSSATGETIETVVRSIAAKKAELRPERARSFLRPAVASVLATIVSVNLFLTPSPAQAAPAKALSDISQATTLYYVKLRRRVIRAFYALLRSTAGSAAR